MKKILIPIIALFFFVCFICLIIGLTFGFGYLNIFYTETVVAGQQDANRKVFENTRSYNQGKIQELGKLKQEYDSADEDDKPGLRSVIRHRFADYNEKELPGELSLFLRKMRGY